MDNFDRDRGPSHIYFTEIILTIKKKKFSDIAQF